MLTKRLLIIGGGGHAKVVYDAIRTAGVEVTVTIYDDNPLLHGSSFLEPNPQVVETWTPAQYHFFHIAVGENTARRALSRRVSAEGLTPYSIVHSAAVISPYAKIGDASFIAALARIAPAAVIGEGSIVNHLAVIDHDCRIGAYCHVAPGAVICGGVKVGDGTLIGARATVLPGLEIGTGVVVGAGAVVTRNVADYITVIGNPAKVLK